MVFQVNGDPYPGQAFFFDTTGQFAVDGTSGFHFDAFVGYP
jgi:hypothetical protein